MNMCTYVKGCVNNLLSESEIKLSLILFSVVSLTAIMLMVSNINPHGVELPFAVKPFLFWLIQSANHMSES